MLLVGAINNISKTIPVRAIGKTQIPINLWSKNLKWSSPLKTLLKAVNSVSGCLYDGPFSEGEYGLTKADEEENFANFLMK